jgi:hypothetical protein
MSELKDVFCVEIKSVTLFSTSVGVTTVTGNELLVTREWFNRYTPRPGDYLTQCGEGFLSVCPVNAYNAIKQLNGKGDENGRTRDII